MPGGRTAIRIVGLLVPVALVATAVRAAPGDLDPGFGHAGMDDAGPGALSRQLTGEAGSRRKRREERHLPPRRGFRAGRPAEGAGAADAVERPQRRVALTGAVRRSR